MVCATVHFFKIMFVITISILFALSNAARLDNAYLPPNAQAPNGLDFLRTPNRQNQEYPQDGIYAQEGGFSNRFDQNENYEVTNAESRPERPQAAFERSAGIIRQDAQNDGESYAYAYETENGIVAEENGVATNGVEAQGGYSYMGDDGQVYSIRYTADQNGFVPQGDHLPTPPPIPEEILKALEQNARDEAAGIYDDGSYNEAKYGDDNQSHFTRGEGYRNEDSVVTNAAGYDNQLNYGNPARNFGNQGVFGRQEGNQGPAEASNTYLPPKVNQRTEARFENRNGYYNARNGYRY